MQTQRVCGGEREKERSTGKSLNKTVIMFWMRWRRKMTLHCGDNLFSEKVTFGNYICREMELELLIHLKKDGGNVWIRLRLFKRNNKRGVTLHSSGALLSHRRWRTGALENKGQTHELLACLMQPMELKHCYHLKVWWRWSSVWSFSCIWTASY